MAQDKIFFKMADYIGEKVNLPHDEHISSETQSEISSINSDWNDLQQIANQLGIINVEDLFAERFKIDRQQLSNLIQGNFTQFCFTSLRFSRSIIKNRTNATEILKIWQKMIRKIHSIDNMDTVLLSQA